MDIIITTILYDIVLLLLSRWRFRTKRFNKRLLTVQKRDNKWDLYPIYTIKQSSSKHRANVKQT